jgi:hypothetical protein
MYIYKWSVLLVRMDAGTRQKRVEALELIKNKAMDMASQGADSGQVRDFITEAKTDLAYELPDEDAFRKAARATLAYKKKKGWDSLKTGHIWAGANYLGFFVAFFGLIGENNYKNGIWRSKITHQNAGGGSYTPQIGYKITWRFSHTLPAATYGKKKKKGGVFTIILSEFRNNCGVYPQPVENEEKIVENNDNFLCQFTDCHTNLA